MTVLPCFVVRDGLEWKCDVCGRHTGGPLGFLQVCPKLHASEPSAAVGRFPGPVPVVDGQPGSAASGAPDGGTDRV